MALAELGVGIYNRLTYHISLKERPGAYFISNYPSLGAYSKPVAFVITGTY